MQAVIIHLARLRIAILANQVVNLWILVRVRCGYTGFIHKTVGTKSSFSFSLGHFVLGQ